MYHSVYLLYVDEYGTSSYASEQHFILAGIAVFERQTDVPRKAKQRVRSRLRDR